MVMGDRANEDVGGPPGTEITFVDLQAAAEQMSEGGFSARCLKRLPGGDHGPVPRHAGHATPTASRCR